MNKITNGKNILEHIHYVDDTYSYDFKNLRFSSPTGFIQNNSMTVTDDGQLRDVFGIRIRLYTRDQDKLDQAYSDYLIEGILLEGNYEEV